LKQIGDISMGDEERFKSLTLAFAQMSSTGKLMGQDLLQMINAGFNPLSVIAEKTGKSIGQLKKDMEAGAVSSEMVADAFRMVTAEGGRFYGMTQKQAEGIRGLQAQLEGSLQEAFNNLGKASQEIIVSGYKGAKLLVDNYEKAGKVLAALITTYGAYRAAVALNIVAERGWTLSQMANYRALLLVEKAHKLLNATMLSNPYVLVASLAVGMATALWALHDGTTAEEKAQERLNKQFDTAREKKETLMQRTGELVNRINDETAGIYSQLKAWKELQLLLPEVFGSMTMSGFRGLSAEDIKLQINTAADKREIDEITSAYERQREAVAGLDKKVKAAEGSAESRTFFGKRKINGLKEEYREASAVLDGLKAKIDIVNEALATGTVPVAKARNRDYWEKAKKEAEGLLEQMDVSEKGTGEWNELAKKIAEAEANLKKYNVTSKDKADGNEAQRRIDAALKVSEQERKIAADRIRLQQEVEQGRINVMKEGYDKRMAQINLDYEKEKQSIREKAGDMLKTLQETERKEWEAGGKKGTFTPSVTTLPVDMQEQIDEANRVSDEALKQNTAKLYGELLREFEDYQTRRTRIAEEYAKKIADIEKLRSTGNTAEVDKAIAEAQKQMNTSLASLDDQFAKTTDAISLLFTDMKDRSVAQMREIAGQAQRMLDFVLSGDFDADTAQGFGITEAQFKSLNEEWSKSPEKLQAVRKAIRELRAEADASDTAFNKMASGLKKVFHAKDNSKNLQQGLTELSDGFNSVSQMAGTFGDALRNIGELSGSDIFGSIADGLSRVMDVAGGAMQGAQASAAFGPIGAAIGAGLGLVSSVTKIFADNRKHREELKKAIADNQEKAYFGEMELNRLYRERYEWAQKTGESQLAGIKRQGEELKKQTLESVKDRDDLWDKLMKQTYKAGEHFEKTGLFGWGKGKTVTDWASLAGKTWEDIEKLAAQGKLSEEGRKYYEALKKAKEEGYDLAARQEEYVEKVKELTTGSTYEGVVSGIVEGFKQGKRSAADFADTFDELMQGAVVSALNLLADEKMRKWYEDFAAMGGDGYTDEEIREAKEQYLSYMEQLSRDAQAIEKATGITLGSPADALKGSSKGLASMSQGSADELNGKFTTMLIYQDRISTNAGNINGLLQTGLGHLAAISANTGYCRRLENMDKTMTVMQKGLDAIVREGIYMKK
jgi:tape measure domain-containing protein